MLDWAEATGQVREDFDGMDYKEREALKGEAWELYRNSTNVADKVRAIEMVIHAHYDRSRASYRGRHPGFQTFARHWVWATEENRFSAKDPEVQDALVKKYPPPAKPRIKKGHSYWGTM